MSTRPLWLAGATATGKSAVAILLAEHLHGEIISVDSMQVYRGLDIGTAKPNAADQRRVRHHLIDVAELTQPFDAAQFVRSANEAVKEIQARGRRPIFCGGTGLYFKAFLDGLGEAPPADAALRAKLEATPLVELLDELSQKDPATFEKIDRQNPRRVIRAVEVIRLTGKPFSAQRSEWPKQNKTGEAPPMIWGLARQPADLHARINERVDGMFEHGLVAEVKKLLEQGLEQNRAAMQAIGYRQVVEHLRGEHSLAQTIELVKIRTRQFAKRQLTWFRRQLPMNWIECEARETAEAVASRMIALKDFPHGQ
ncbi:MAG TPA: tRNA (adenosine(37)-N6)-dimethylallyltransferase MiaA [Verrucomicrobiae bacterium]|jgi:tRNA dimethylallyltransferase|nr:tRNA (adenosine(37)-N6)-dimethylallyltransferase MiaA [Verrucomicrobiae bacterium]